MSLLSRVGADAMRKRPVEVVDVTTDDTKVVEHPADLKGAISKLPKLDPSLRNRLSAKELRNMEELRNTADWFEGAYPLFSGAMPESVVAESICFHGLGHQTVVTDNLTVVGIIKHLE